MINDQINSMISVAELNGTHYYDRWEIMGCYSGIMTGNPEVVVINDAWQKGIRGCDSEKAYEYAVNTTLKSGNSKLGYCRGSISDTTEYGLDEWNVGQFTAWGRLAPVRLRLWLDLQRRGDDFSTSWSLIRRGVPRRGALTNPVRAN